MCPKSDNLPLLSTVYKDALIVCKHCNSGQDAHAAGVHKMLQPVTEEHVSPRSSTEYVNTTNNSLIA